MKKLIATFLICCSSPAFASDNAGWGFFLERGSVEDEAAQREGIGTDLDGGGMMGLFQAELSEQSALQLQGGFGVVSASDENQFRSFTVDNRDNKGYRSSSVSGYSMFVEAGYDFQFNANIGTFIAAGYRNYSLDRSISACKDCPEEDVELESSSYLHLGGSFNVTDSSRILLGYQHYFSGELVNALKIQWLMF